MLEIAEFVGALSVALLGLLLVRRRVPLQSLKEQHDVAGVAFAVIGGFYGVLLAFVLVASWERFERARANTEAEANALGDLYRQASGVPEATATALRGDVVAYLHSVIESEWPAMTEGTFSAQTQQLYFQVWSTVLDMPADDSKTASLFQCMVGKLDDFGEARRYRLLYMQNGLPPVIWDFLLGFGVITVGFTYFFGMPRVLPQAIITVVLTGAIVCTLFIIREMQTPFSGTIVVPDRAFRVALEFIQSQSPPRPIAAKH
jgi:hypothetical protein